MTQAVRPCPKCGSANIDADDNEVDGVVCVDCGFWMDYHPIGRDETLDLWNERPLEDALRSEITRLNAYADKLADALPEGGLPQDIDTRRAANFALAQENHELRAEVERLRRDYAMLEALAPPDMPRADFVKLLFAAWERMAA